jgi:transposase
VPIERYVSIAARDGVVDLPQNSLIESTHQVADFILPVITKILDSEIKTSQVLHVDDTTHRMLKKPDQAHYLWGLSNQVASYFEVHGTRSGKVISDLLLDSRCEYLVSDAFSGNSKSVKDINVARLEAKRTPMTQVYCNAHARRKFKEARESTQEAQVYIDLYKKIYFLESQVKGKPPNEVLVLRGTMWPYFEELKKLCEDDREVGSRHSAIAKAREYFLTKYESLTTFLDKAELPIDNNPQERLLRNPVIGRKTWYGTQTERGAKTNAVLFTVVESCKLNKINPREYLKNLVLRLHQSQEPLTPNEYRKLRDLEEKSTG